MPVTHWFMIKSLTFPSSWIALLIAFIITGLIVWKRYGKAAESRYSDVVIILIVVWKLSVIITDFGMVRHSPMMILYFNGGKPGFYLGLAVALTWMIRSLRKNGYSVRDSETALMSIILIQCIYQLMMIFLNEGTNWQGMLTFFLFLVMAIAAFAYISKGTLWRIQLAVIMVLVMLFAGSFQPMGMNQTPIWATVLSIAAVMPILLGQHKRKSSEERI